MVNGGYRAALGCLAGFTVHVPFGPLAVLDNRFGLGCALAPLIICEVLLFGFRLDNRFASYPVSLLTTPEVISGGDCAALGCLARFTVHVPFGPLALRDNRFGLGSALAPLIICEVPLFRFGLHLRLISNPGALLFAPGVIRSRYCAALSCFTGITVHIPLGPLAVLNNRVWLWITFPLLMVG